MAAFGICSGGVLAIWAGQGSVPALLAFGYYLVCFLAFPFLFSATVGYLDSGQDWGLDEVFTVTFAILLFVPPATLYTSMWTYAVAGGLMISVLCLAYTYPRYRWRESPFHRAVILGKAKAVGRLLQQGWNVNAHDHEGTTPLIRAIEAGHTEVVRQLLEAGADPHDCGQGKSPPLVDACNRNVGKQNLKIVQLLLEHGAEVDYKGESSYTPLLILCDTFRHESQAEIIRLLVRKGADVNARDFRGLTPLMLVIRSDIRKKAVIDPIVNFLLAHGADVSAKSPEGLTALSLAHRENRPSVVEKLRAHKRMKTRRPRPPISRRLPFAGRSDDAP